MKKLLKHIVFIGLFSISSGTWAGSYDDFFKAIAIDDVRGVQSLLARGFDPNTLDPAGTPGLIKALQEQSFKCAEFLTNVPQTDVNASNVRQETALMLAALRGRADLVEALVSRGAAINTTGWSALHYAATGGHARIAAFLIGAGAQVNAQSPNGTSALMMAAMYGNDATVKLLLQSGADLDLINQQGLTALDFAQRAGREDNLRLLHAAEDQQR